MAETPTSKYYPVVRVNPLFQRAFSFFYLPFQAGDWEHWQAIMDHCTAEFINKFGEQFVDMWIYPDSIMQAHSKRIERFKFKDFDREFYQ